MELLKSLIDQNKMTQMIGTPYYVAPEVLKGCYNEKCDIWSVGVIMFFLLSGAQPFGGSNNKAIFKAVSRGDFKFKSEKWKEISQSAKNLIVSMLAYNPHNRISAAEALGHEWFKKFDTNELNQKSLKSAFSGLLNFKANQTMQQAVLGYLY